MDDDHPMMIRNQDQLVAAIRQAKIERNISCERLDELAGVPKGYSSKILGPARPKKLGPMSLWCLLGALGKAIVVADDPEAVAKLEGRWIPRREIGGAIRELRRAGILPDIPGRRRPKPD
jgi:hypothetical protein